MNPWLSFLLGGVATCLCIGATVGWALAVIANDDKLSLTAIATVLRSFAKRFTELHVVVQVGEIRVLVPLQQIATAIERAEMVSDLGDDVKEEDEDASAGRPSRGMEN